VENSFLTTIYGRSYCSCVGDLCGSWQTDHSRREIDCWGLIDCVMESLDLLFFLMTGLPPKELQTRAKVVRVTCQASHQLASFVCP